MKKCILFGYELCLDLKKKELYPMSDSELLEYAIKKYCGKEIVVWELDESYRCLVNGVTVVYFNEDRNIKLKLFEPSHKMAIKHIYKTEKEVRSKH